MTESTLLNDAINLLGCEAICIKGCHRIFVPLKLETIERLQILAGSTQQEAIGETVDSIIEEVVQDSRFSRQIIAKISEKVPAQ